MFFRKIRNWPAPVSELARRWMGHVRTVAIPSIGNQIQLICSQLTNDCAAGCMGNPNHKGGVPRILIDLILVAASSNCEGRLGVCQTKNCLFVELNGTCCATVVLKPVAERITVAADTGERLRLISSLTRSDIIVFIYDGKRLHYRRYGKWTGCARCCNCCGAKTK